MAASNHLFLFTDYLNYLTPASYEHNILSITDLNDIGMLLQIDQFELIVVQHLKSLNYFHQKTANLKFIIIIRSWKQFILIFYSIDKLSSTYI